MRSELVEYYNYFDNYLDKMDYRNNNNFKSILETAYVYLPVNWLRNLDKVILTFLIFNRYQNVIHKRLIRKIFKDLISSDVTQIIADIYLSISKRIPNADENEINEIHILIRNLEIAEEILKLVEYRFKGRFSITDKKPFLKKRNSVRDLLELHKDDDDMSYVYWDYREFDYYNNLIKVWGNEMKKEFPNACIFTEWIKLNLTKLTLPKEFKEKYNKSNCRYLVGLLLLEGDLVHKTMGGSRVFAHANAIIFDRRDEVVYRIDPWGGKEEEQHHKIFKQQFNKLFGKDWTVLSGFEICPYTTGPQLIESESGDKIHSPLSNEDGYCFIWSLLIAHRCLAYPNHSPSEIVQDLLTIDYYSERQGEPMGVGLYPLIIDYTSWLMSVYLKSKNISIEDYDDTPIIDDYDDIIEDYDGEIFLYDDILED